MFHLIVILGLLPLAIGTVWNLFAWACNILRLVWFATVGDAVEKACAREKAKSVKQSEIQAWLDRNNIDCSHIDIFSEAGDRANARMGQCGMTGDACMVVPCTATDKKGGWPTKFCVNVAFIDHLTAIRKAAQ